MNVGGRQELASNPAVWTEEKNLDEFGVAMASFSFMNLG